MRNYCRFESHITACQQKHEVLQKEEDGLEEVNDIEPSHCEDSQSSSIRAPLRNSGLSGSSKEWSSEYDLESEDRDTPIGTTKSKRSTTPLPTPYIEAVKLGGTGTMTVRTHKVPVRGKLWGPFRTREDFEFAETAIVHGLKQSCIKSMLDGVNGRWANNSKLTMFNVNDLNESLAAAHNFVPQFKEGEIGNPNDTVENEDDTPSSVELAQFKREMYHKVLCVILRSLRKRSHHGDTLKCGDKIRRVLYPGFVIHSIDGEESCSSCGTRGPKAKHPCPKCLAIREELTRFSKIYTPQTQADMMGIIKQVKAVGVTARMSILRDVGLYFVENTFWKIHNSDPYAAYSYDVLHTFDLGEWGKHMWPLVLSVLGHVKNRISRSMRRIPCWRGLKHFQNVAEIPYADGNTYWDILKCIIPCIVQLLPHNSPLLHSVRLCAILRALAGLRVVSEDHLKTYKQFLVKYETYCKKITKDHGKNFNYPKHHNLIHLPGDIEHKGNIENFSTRPGEGFQQEIQQAYKLTNFKDTDPQASLITRIDENQEVIARIRMFVDSHDEQLHKAASAEAQTGDCEPVPIPVHFN
ncbi:hypothetical protein M422DRAFT_265393 [Sphaerobolus stellatus SS14]|uniref:Uncharacterized protein n=1 Tax=Sphaerobolus stellatus (strain SS14) TaxID=990650 RepID=A0A0C9V5T4_SPHS4|nr:hypothetical protein M422DRAFT_265393 [Sphaerobolus stellatus SS14]